MIFTFAKLLELAGSHVGIGKYLDENPEKFQEFLDGFSTDMSDELEKFAKMYLADYNHLYSEATAQVAFLKSFDKQDVKSGVLCAGETIPMIQTYKDFDVPSGTEDVSRGDW